MWTIKRFVYVKNFFYFQCHSPSLYIGKIECVNRKEKLFFFVEKSLTAHRKTEKKNKNKTKKEMQ